MSIQRAIEILETLLDDHKINSVRGMQYAVSSALDELKASLPAEANPPDLGVHVAEEIKRQDIVGGGG